MPSVGNSSKLTRSLARVVALAFGKAESEKETPEVLSIQEIRSILNELPSQFRTLVFLFACTGMRFSELRGLKWMDVDFASLYTQDPSGRREEVCGGP